MADRYLCPHGHDLIEVSRRIRTWTERERVEVGEREVRGTPFIDGGSSTETVPVYATEIVSYASDIIRYSCRNCPASTEQEENSREVSRRRAMF